MFNILQQLILKTCKFANQEQIHIEIKVFDNEKHNLFLQIKS